MTLQVTEIEKPPAALREAYFASLPEPQVHYVEQRVAVACWLLLSAADAPSGYLAIHHGAVVEFFATDALLPQLSDAFYAAAAHGGATSAVLKSYDELALVAVSGRPAEMTTLGVNCTAWADERFDPPPGFTHRRAEPGDIETILAVGPGLFESPDEIVPLLGAGQMLIYALDGEAIGCGIATPVRQGADAFDIGVGVLPAWRGRRLGEQIIRHLKRHCLRELGVRPVCGCAVENIASRRTLERAGFLTRHRVLKLRWT